jgi:hypothetical protein
MTSAKQAAASGWTIALSVSESPDLEVLGLFNDEDKKVLSAILTPLIYGGARIAYGGRIEPHAFTNFTQEISAQLAAAYRESGGPPEKRPYIHYLRDNDARRGQGGAARLLAHALKLGSYSEIRLLRGLAANAILLPSGPAVDVYVDRRLVGAVEEAAELMAVPRVAEIFSDATGRDELADMRAVMARDTQARIIMGGRVAGGAGGTSGVVAEALATLKVDKPLLVVGGIGGASRDVASTLGLIDDEEELVQREDSLYRDRDKKLSKDRYWAHVKELDRYSDRYRLMLESKGVLAEARRLALSESYAEIGSLIVMMLSKLLQPGLLQEHSAPLS